MDDKRDPNVPKDTHDVPSSAPAGELRERVRAAERRGLEALEVGDFETASRFLLQAVTGYEELGDQRSTHSAAYYFGVSLAAQGKTAQALRVWEEVVERGLDSPSAYTRLIRHYEDQNDQTQVRRLLDKLGQAASERTGEFFASVDQTPVSARHVDPESGADSNRRPRALIADDEEGIRAVVKRTLESAGYDVVLAADGNEALETILSRPLELVILDVFMPGHTGLDVLYRIRAEGIPTRVVVISGRGDEQMVHDAQRLGADWLGKPFSIEVLERMARGLLEDRARARPEGGPEAL
jgi:CheY-like chemotaxis protein